MPAPANTGPEYTRRLNELAATVIDLFESRPQCVETLVLMNNELLRFERQFGLRPIFGYSLHPHENYRIDTDPPCLLSTAADVETFLLSLPRNGIDDEINNEARAQDPGDIFLLQPLRFSHQDVNEFMFSLPRVQINNYLDECNICRQPFNKPGANSLVSEVIKELKDTAASHAISPRICVYHMHREGLREEAVRLPCGHIFGSPCIRTWISGEWSGNPPSCPSCRALLPRFGQVSTRPFPLMEGSGTYYPFSEEANMESATSALHDESDVVPAASATDDESLTEPEISDEELESQSAVDSEYETAAEELENEVDETEDGVIDMNTPIMCIVQAVGYMYKYCMYKYKYSSHITKILKVRLFGFD